MTSFEAILSAVSQKYISIHVIDIEADSYEAFKSIDLIDHYCQGKSSAQDALYNAVDHLTKRDSRENIKEFTNLSTLTDRLKNNVVVQCPFFARLQGWCEASFLRLANENNDGMKCVVFMVEDINDRVCRESAIMDQAHTIVDQAANPEVQAIVDPLTGLLNQAGMECSIKDFLKMCPNSSCVLLTLDVDDFKLINDIFGHTIGDNVLKTVADILKDKCPKPCFLARNGGDEFMVFFTNTTLESVRAFLQTFANSPLSFVCGGVSHQFSLSMGAAEYPTHSPDYCRLREKADIALYAVKMSNKNGFQIYCDSLEERQRAQLGFNISDIARGLPGSFVVYKVDTNEQILFANDDAIHLVGCDDLQDFMKFSGGRFVNMIHPQDLERVRQTVYELHRINNGNEHTDGFVKFRIVSKQGKEINVECAGRRVFNRFHGDIIYIFIQESSVKEQYIKFSETVYPAS